MSINNLSSGASAPDRVHVAVVIPCFRAAETIAPVLRRIGPLVRSIYVVDDCCPDGSGERALRDHADPRLTVLHNPHNLGVGGAMKRGYRRALADGADIVVKLDADGQMHPEQIGRLIAPILAGTADYAKGDRFAPARLMPPGSCPRALAAMPARRWLANRILSLLHRPVTGYWRVRDPANGFTAVHAGALERIDMGELSDCFFFETDMLFRLGLAGAMVVEIPLPAVYEGALSSLSLRRVALRFARLILWRLGRRLRSRILSGPSSTASRVPLWCRNTPC